MSNVDTNVQTSVQQVDLDLDSWLGAPGAESIITPAGDEEEVKKPGMFSKSGTNLDFLNEEPTFVNEDKKDENVSRETNDGKTVLDELEIESVDDEEPKKTKTEKSGLVGFLKKRIESKEMFAFDDYDESKQDLEEYLGTLSEKDVDDLWQANIDNLKQEVASNTPKEFFESLPDELQYAAKYVMDGGQDLKGLFQALAQVEEVRQMDPADENDQEGIVRSYLQATNFGSAEEIEEELSTWKDLGTLEKKAKQFKPKLDQMQEKIVQYQVAEQEARKQQQEEAAQTYMENVFHALKPAEINGLKLDKKTQAQLYSGLTQPQYPSISGRPTNQLGHLLEKYQFVEPNYPLIAEALWLLSDPEAYRQNLVKQGKNQAVEQTVRQLKTEQSRKASTSYDDDTKYQPQQTKKVSRPTNIFKR
jgi:hypothetical protein